MVGVIPARYGSSRFPGKPLTHILGKCMLQWVIEGARSSKKLQEIWVASDHAEILALAKSLGAKAIETDADLPTGSDRVWAAVKNENVDVVVNIQGDEPLLDGKILDALAGAFENDPQLPMATLGRKIDDEALLSPNTAKIILNQQSEAIYFSRQPIPYSKRDAKDLGYEACLKHIGLYAYRKEFLGRFCAQKPVLIEEAEGLEQLRALYLGARIKVIRVEHESWGVDTPEDVVKIEKIMRARGYK